MNPLRSAAVMALAILGGASLGPTSIGRTRVPYTPQPGDGVKRAEARERAKRKALAEVPDTLDYDSRQVRRALDRKFEKKRRSAMKRADRYTRREERNLAQTPETMPFR